MSNQFRLKVIINGGPCAPYICTCLRSLLSQDFLDWNAMVTLDPWGDGAYEKAMTLVGNDPRFEVVQNRTKRFAMTNLVNGIARSRANPADVIVILDADDWLLTDRAFSIIHQTYNATQCWMTYGSWRCNVPEFGKGLWPAYPPETTNFRTGRWLGTAVRTWKKWLWDHLDDADLRDNEGNYFRVTEDQAVMMPLLEMSGTQHARHIAEPLMMYNRANPHCCGQIHYAEMKRNEALIRARPPYRPLIPTEQAWRRFNETDSTSRPTLN